MPFALSYVHECTAVTILSHGNKITYVVPRCSLIQFYPESGIQNNKCNTVNICEHGTNQQV